MVEIDRLEAIIKKHEEYRELVKDNEEKKKELEKLKNKKEMEEEQKTAGGSIAK